MRRLSRHSPIWALAVAVVLVARILLMSATPVLDPTEGRYAEVGRQMLVTRNWLVPQVWIEGRLVPFLGKPPLHFWGMAFMMKLMGANAFAARLPAFVMAVLLLGLMGIVIERFACRQRALAAVAITASSALFFIMAGAAATDMTLAVCVGSALLMTMAFLAERNSSWRRGWSLGVFVSLGAGFMVKGPVALVLYGLPVFTWHVCNGDWTRLRYHRWASGIALFGMLTIPWFALSEIRNPGFLNYFFIHENLLRYTVKDYGDLYGSGHVYPYGSALWMLFVAALPWSFVALVAGIRRPAWRPCRSDFRDPFRGLALISIVTVTLFWCACRQLLITYLLPVVPMVAVWIALKAPPGGLAARRLSRYALGVAVCMVAVMTAAIPSMEQHSARGPVKRARQLIENGDADAFIMLRSTPYSAYFYGGAWIVPHGKESVTKGVELAAASGKRCIVIVTEHHLERMDMHGVGTPVTLAIEHGWWLVLFPSKVAMDEPLGGHPAAAEQVDS